MNQWKWARIHKRNVSTCWASILLTCFQSIEHARREFCAQFCSQCRRNSACEEETLTSSFKTLLLSVCFKRFLWLIKSMKSLFQHLILIEVGRLVMTFDILLTLDYLSSQHGCKLTFSFPSLQYLVPSPKSPEIGTSFRHFSVVLARSRQPLADRVQQLPTRITTTTIMTIRSVKKRIRRLVFPRGDER